MSLRHLVVVLGDQLDRNSSALDGFDRAQDRLWMAEVPEEATHVWSHQARIALFLAAMRHHAQWLRRQGYPLTYLRQGEHGHTALADALAAEVEAERPKRLVVVQPGEHRVLQDLRRLSVQIQVPLEVRPDRHFLIELEEFEAWLRARKRPTLEHFYRHLRKRSGLLMDDGRPLGGRWNFDQDNRKPFGRQGPGALPEPRGFPPDALTREVLQEVAASYASHPGSLAGFDWPVTAEQAAQALEDFVEHRLAAFGPHQDAMWTGQPWLYHSRLAAAMNLKLLSPRRVIDAAVEARAQGGAPLASVEGFVRQILGWREYVRGLYWTQMPDYLDRNALAAQEALPAFYWSGDTDMRCLAEAIGQTLQHGYAHHIQRLMVTGLFALLLGVAPRRVHEWYLAVYVDAVEWVELPNTLGMSQHADGGLMATKPYVASGKYLERMSDYCRHCRYDPAQRTGPAACPFTTLYWDFLMRHEERFRDHPRVGLQWRNLDRLSAGERTSVRRQASALRESLQPGGAEACTRPS